MEIFRLHDFPGGWFLGNFEPSLWREPNVEIAFKTYKSGDVEPTHFQRSSTEVTLLVRGKCFLGGQTLSPGDIAVIPPLEAADFTALEDCELIAIKCPSLPQDKFLGEP